MAATKKIDTLVAKEVRAALDAYAEDYKARDFVHNEVAKQFNKAVRVFLASPEFEKECAKAVKEVVMYALECEGTDMLDEKAWSAIYSTISRSVVEKFK